MVELAWIAELMDTVSLRSMVLIEYPVGKETGHGGAWWTWSVMPSPLLGTVGSESLVNESRAL